MLALIYMTCAGGGSRSLHDMWKGWDDGLKSQYHIGQWFLVSISIINIDNIGNIRPDINQYNKVDKQLSAS